MSNTRINNELEGVAVIGMEGRFPGARNVEEFWRNLRDGVESVSFFTEEELLSAGVDPPRLHDPNYVRAKGFLEDGDAFDASFFGFSPREAELMDPQHRVFMECVWQALESAGYDPQKFQGSIGLYAGASMNTYLLFNLLSQRGLVESAGNLQTSIQNRTDHLTTHVAYELNLKGPAVTVQTACSTSLVAVHLACQSLLSGECDMALAGGASVTVPLKNGYAYQEGGILSPDGHCRAFDAGARGTVDGDGVAVVVLKRLADALADGDHIHAVIRGSAINNDGSHKVGFTAPGVNGQAEVIAEAHAVAGVDAGTITYVEAHGTGTTLGDPIEIDALTQAFRLSTDRKQFCAVGSAKTNVGHLDAAAGVTGLIKTVLALKHKQLPPSLNFGEPNPNIGFADGPFFVNAELRPWETGGVPRRAGVSSFGIGGTNAHVVLEEAPAAESAEPAEPRRGVQVLALSARTTTALDAATLNLSAFLREHPEVPLADVAYTLHFGRRDFDYRRVIVCRAAEDAVNSMETLDHRTVFTGLQETRTRPVVMMFPGQGAQYVGMGRELYESEEVFRREFDACAQLLLPELGFDLREVVFAEGDEAAERLRQTAVTQPALFAVEYALARQWMEWGVLPEAMIGHSIGEYVAACVAGVFSLEEALRLVATRGRLMQSLPGGSMLAVHLPEREVAALLVGTRLSLAAVNAPSLCVVSGTTEEIDRLERDLNERGAGCRRLHTSHAFHSDMVEPVLARFREEVSKVSLSAPRVPFISNVTGAWITDAEATDPEYWVRHLRQPVLFDAGAGEMFKDAERIMLEVGPGRTLSTLIRHHPFKGAARLVLQSLRHADETGDDREWMLRALGRLWLAGNEVSWEKLYEGEQRLRVALPTYPFERKRYWVEARRGADGAQASLHKKADPAEWFYVPSWKRTPAPAFDAAAGGEGRRWLLFADEGGLGRRMAARLEEAGQEVYVVEPGEKFAAAGPRAYTVGEAARADYAALLAEVGASDKKPLAIVHLWNVTGREEAGEDAASSERAQRRSFDGLLALAQGLSDAGVVAPVRLSVVTTGMAEVTGEEELSPEKALVLGACRVMPQEMENVNCRAVDVSVTRAADAERERLVLQLIAEAVFESPEQVVAYRGRHRWAQTFEPSRLSAPAAPATRLRERGVYVITGGLGGMALEFAEYLAREARARIALLARTPLPERGRWAEYLAQRGERDAVARKIRRLQALEASGAEVLVLAADVADEGQVRAALTAVRRQFGEINGVIHTAGVPGGGVLQLKTAEAAAGVLAPKVRGTRVLARALGETGLDFFALCSSRSAILGGFGQIDYCAANAFLDAFAHYNTSRRGTFTVSIDWDAWQEVGMLVSAAAQYDGGGEESPQTIRQTGHPLLDRQIVEEEGREVYATEVSPSTHWALDDHRIVGAAIMPGTAYLEMARAAFERRPRENAVVEIRDAFFLAPLGMRDDEALEVRTVLEGVGDEYEYRILGRPSGAEAGAAWQQFSIGRIGYVEAGGQRRLDIAAIRERCRLREVFITEDYEMDPDLGPRWQSLRQVFVGDNELLAVLELPEEFDADFRQYRLHPALLDRATGTAKHYLTSGGHYLPMSYKRLRIKGDLPRKVYTYIKYRDDLSVSKETITFDIVVTDEHGVERIDIEGFSQKRVNDTAEPLRTLGRAKPNEARAGAGGDGAYARSLGEGLTPAEGVEAFRRILAAEPAPQVVVSTKDLGASIERARSLTQSRVAEEVAKLEVARPAHARPSMSSAYVAPRNETEETLCEILQTMLGIEQVGVHDNFFDLGGDSVLGIQIIAKANRAGIKLTPQQIFQHQTVAEMAAVAGHAPAPAPARPATPATAPPATEDLTPSDFPLAGLDREKMSKLSALIEDSDEEEDDQLEEDGGSAEVERVLRGHTAVREAVVVPARGAGERPLAYVTLEGTPAAVRKQALDFSLFYFADASGGDDKYRLYLEGAKYADRHGFSAVWTPERHFHPNGGLYPSPSVLSAALATATERIRLRAGSVVLPLHSPIRVAEEWAIVDNLSKGRVDISITSGWIPNDFAFFPERFADKRGEMFRLLEEVNALWRGDAVRTRDGAGNMVELKVYPKPVQHELPVWLTCSGDPQMFVKAGELGLNVLTALLTQSVDEVAAKIALYREARARAGHDPAAGHVTLMMHTFVGEDQDEVVRQVRGPLCEYLKSHVGLVKTMVNSLDLRVDLDNEEYLDYLVEFAFERYYQTASLIGTPEKCLAMVERLKGIGVDEVACFVDFGVEAETVLAGLRHLDALKGMSERASGSQARASRATADSLRSFAAERLPSHLVPAEVVVLDALPRTSGGDLDRASLPTPAAAHAE